MDRDHRIGVAAGSLDRARARERAARAAAGALVVRVRAPRGVWSPFEADDEIARHLADAYAAQTEEIRRAEADGDVDELAFAANVSELGGADVPPGTYAVWSQGVETILPLTNYVVLRRTEPTEEMTLVRFADAIALAGDLLVPVPATYPPRLRTQGFPSPETFAALAARSPNADRARAASTRTIPTGGPERAAPAAYWGKIAVVAFAIVALIVFELLGF